eukprot:g49024.t1
MQALDYDSSVFDSLPSLHAASSALKPLRDKALTALTEVIRQFGMEEVVGVQLLHRHFALAPSEKLLERNSEDGKTSVSSPVEVSQLSSAPTLCTPRIFALKTTPLSPSASTTNSATSLEGWAPCEFTTEPAAAKLSKALFANTDFLHTYAKTLVGLNLQDVLGLGLMDPVMLRLLKQQQLQQQQHQQLQQQQDPQQQGPSPASIPCISPPVPSLLTTAPRTLVPNPLSQAQSSQTDNFISSQTELTAENTPPAHSMDWVKLERSSGSGPRARELTTSFVDRQELDVLNPRTGATKRTYEAWWTALQLDRLHMTNDPPGNNMGGNRPPGNGIKGLFKNRLPFGKGTRGGVKKQPGPFVCQEFCEGSTEGSNPVHDELHVY